MRRSLKFCVFCALALYFGPTQVLAQGAEEPAISWPVDFFDPGQSTQKADLVLPMPCGGAMAFQKVIVPLDVENPIDDRRLRLGQSAKETGYSDYFRSEFLRGPFDDPLAGVSYYYIGRYELSVGQFKALHLECGETRRRDRLARGGLSWFDAVDLSRRYTVWLMENAQDRMPHKGNAISFVRLPTETEWEFAVRGGISVDPIGFARPRFFEQDPLADFAIHQSGSSSSGRLKAIGLRAANPIGMFDVYGNAEELMLEPFRLNALGRNHGQVGGIVTRGGSVLSAPDQIYSAQRTEYPPFDPATGQPLASETFGVRFVLSAHVTTSDERVRTIRDRWVALAETVSESLSDTVDPLAQLTQLAEAEIDPRRKTALNDLQLEFRLAREKVGESLDQTAKSTLLTGAVLVEVLNNNARKITSKVSNIRMLVALQRSAQGSFQGSGLVSSQLGQHARQLTDMRRLEVTYLLSLQSALEVLSSKLNPTAREAAYSELKKDLTGSGQDQILRMLDRFWEDLLIYQQNPELSPGELLEITLH